MSQGKKRTIIIGLDGVPFSLLKDLSDKGIMPNSKEIILKGVLREMRSSIPEVSAVAWSSIITGCNPAEHGIFGFTDLSVNTYSLRFPNFDDLETPPFWNAVKGRSIIINVPATYPVKEINGVHISGFVSVDLERSVYPQSLVPKLRELGYRLDVDSELAHKSMDLFLEDLDKTLAARTKAYRFLWSYTDWQVFMLVFTGTDRLMHFLWSAYEDQGDKHHQAFLGHFRKIDKIIGEIYSQISGEDLLIILSDHGFEKLYKDVYINYLLEREGFLKLKDSKNLSLSDIDYSAKAFALDPARIYLNLKGRYPCGSISEGDREKILMELSSLFNSLEIDNHKVIKEMYRKEEVYSGPFLAQAPDLILVGNTGFNLRANIKSEKLTDFSIFSGKHTLDNAFILVVNSEYKEKAGDNLCVYDVRRLFGNNQE